MRPDRVGHAHLFLVLHAAHEGIAGPAGVRHGQKYYGAEKGPALWAGKALALLLTCGYRPERGCDLFEEGMRRYCKHAQLRFLGSHAERHLGYDVPFMDAEKEARTRAFARELWDAVQ